MGLTRSFIVPFRRRIKRPFLSIRYLNVLLELFGIGDELIKVDYFYTKDSKWCREFVFQGLLLGRFYSRPRANPARARKLKIRSNP